MSADCLQISDRAALPARRIHVLCVDDNPVNRRLLYLALARPGWSVEIVNDGQEALDRFAAPGSHRFDLLVTDHCMPRLDGLELVRRLRANHFTGPVIVVTAGDYPAVRAAYREVGVTAFFRIPAITAALRATVEAAAVADGFALPAPSTFPAETRPSAHCRAEVARLAPAMPKTFFT